jgi:L-seryl-tRNA(Ser) seleniumtransferase
MEPFLSAIPPVWKILHDSAFRAASIGLADPYRTRLVRRVIERHRQSLRAGGTAPSTTSGIFESILDQCIREAEAIRRPFPRRVINGTGVLIHTNLGRAPLGDLIAGVTSGDLNGYTDLEWDADSQERGDRELPLQRQLQLLTGAEAALVVNNCAGALFLALNTLAVGKDVLVSRAELVEIGGSFRIPDILRASGCRLREVGTTNKTRLGDFEVESVKAESALLKVHQSNFVQRGFVEQVPLTELVALGRKLDIPVIEDNGSGWMGEGGAALLGEEPRVLESLRKGVDVVCCSADKLFGSIQAGIVLGNEAHVTAMRMNPLYRVLRLDKLRIALLDRTLKQYLAGRADDLPLWRLFHLDVGELNAHADRFCISPAGSRWSCIRRVPSRGRLGGGSNPEASFASVGIELRHRDLSAEDVKRRFAARAVPVVGYIQQDRFYLDLCAILSEDLPELQQALDELGSPSAAAS